MKQFSYRSWDVIQDNALQTAHQPHSSLVHARKACPMKLSHVSLTALVAVILTGCAQDRDLQSKDADLAKQIMAENCEVGYYVLNNGTPPVYTRQGVERKYMYLPALRYTRKMKINPIVVYSIKELGDGWVEVDASGSGSRENFYFNRDTGEFACIIEDWRTVQSNREKMRLERTPLITNQMQRLN